ncbi:MAG: hypothetical protein AAFP02_00260 [Bacteroidota bacterium]
MQLITSLIRLILRLVAVITRSRNASKPAVEIVEKSHPIQVIRQEKLPALIPQLPDDALDVLARTALQEKEESLFLELMERIKDPYLAFRLVKESLPEIHPEEQEVNFLRMISFALKKVSGLTGSETPSSAFRFLITTTAQHLSPQKAWPVLARSPKALEGCSKLDQDSSREQLLMVYLSLLKKIDAHHKASKMVNEMENIQEGIHSVNIKQRCEVQLLEAYLCLFTRFKDEEAWKKAKVPENHFSAAFQIYPLALFVKASHKMGKEQAFRHYSKLFFEAERLIQSAEEDRNDLWTGRLKDIAMVKDLNGQKEAFFEWVTSLDAIYQELEVRKIEEEQYDRATKRRFYFQIAEVCLEYQRAEIARPYLLGLIERIIPDLVPKWNVVPNLEPSFALLDQYTKQTDQYDLLEAFEQNFGQFEDGYSFLLYARLLTSYLKKRSPKVVSQYLQQMPQKIAQAANSTKAIGGRAFHPSLPLIKSEEHTISFLEAACALLPIEEDPFRQAMYLHELLEAFPNLEGPLRSEKAAQTLLTGIDQHGKVMARVIGRARWVHTYHPILSQQRIEQELTEAWELMQLIEFGPEMREYVFWFLPTVMKFHPILGQEIFTSLQQNWQSVEERKEKINWEDTLSYTLSQASISDWGKPFLQQIGTLQHSRSDENRVKIIQGWAEKAESLEQLVDLLEETPKILDPSQRSMALEAIAIAAAKKGAWEYALQWVGYAQNIAIRARGYVQMLKLS